MSAQPRRAAPSRWPLLLLASSLGLVGLTTAVAVLAARRHATTTAQLLRDYAAFAAWSYSQRVSEEIGEGLWYTLSPIQHSSPHMSREMPDAADLVQYRASSLDRCRCAGGVTPATYFRFTLGHKDLLTAGTPFTPTVGAEVLERVGAALHLVEIPVPRSGIVALAGSRLAGYGLMPTEWGDTIVYGFTVDSAALSQTLTKVLRDASLLPSAVTRGTRNDSLLVLQVSDTTGAVLYQDREWPTDRREWPYVAAESLPPFNGGMIAQLSVRPGAAAGLLAGGFPWSPLPPLLIVGLLGIGAAVVAVVQLRREGQLARLRSDFVAGVSHELRTPLAQLRLFLDTLRLRRYDTPEEQAWLLGHLGRETTRLEHLVENVLTVTRLERGVAPDLRHEPLELDRELAETVLAFEPLAASRRAHLETELEPGISIQGDRNALRQLTLNLLDNAVKFGPPGQTVTVGLRKEGDSAIVSVSDQGPGVPPAERQKIWEVYYRGGSAETSAVGGSGIGLAIVQEIATRLGGRVAVTEAPTGGARFEVTLPGARNGGPA